MIEIVPNEKAGIETIPLSMDETRLSNNSLVHSLNTAATGLVKIIISFDDPVAYAQNPVLAEITFQLLKSGTRDKDTFLFVSRMEETGVMLSSYVNPDAGTVEFVVLEDQLDNVLSLVFEMLMEPAFPDKEFARLKTIALQNWRISRQQTHVLAREHFIHALYPRHPYGTMVNETVIAALDRDDVVRFHQDQVLSAKPVFYVAASDPRVAASGMDQKIRQYGAFQQGALKSGPAATAFGDAANGGSLRIPVEKSVQSSIRMGKQLFNRKHEDFIKGKVTTTILGGYFSSRLMANLREDKGYTYGVGAGIATLALGGYLTISADVGNSHLEDAVKEILRELDGMRTNVVEIEELNTVKQYLSGSTYREMDGIFNQLSLMPALHRQGLTLGWMNDFLRDLQKVTPEDVRDFSARYLREEDLVKVLCGEMK